MCAPERWCVVIGGRGFAARHLVEMLLRYDMYSVRIADLAPSINLDPYEEKGTLADGLHKGRAQYASTDLCDKARVFQVCHGAEVVFHMAAPDSSIDNYQLHQPVNVQGTVNIIEACVEHKVKRLIYTSSPSVVFDGVHGIYNGDESLPYPAKHNDSYSATKSDGEALVLKSNGVNGLLTCCIRPSSIFGPGDKVLVPAIIHSARTGKAKFIIGNGKNMHDFTYVENVAHAHVCAERALAAGEDVAEKASGEAYFITNMEPIKFWEFASLLLTGLGYDRPRYRVPVRVLMPMAHMMAGIYTAFSQYGMKVPYFTPSRVTLLSCNRTFNCTKANDRLGYSPIVPLKEGINRTIESFSHLRAEVNRREGPSKASIYLGGGKVADILLWRNRKQTLATLLVLFIFYLNFIAPRYTIITALCKLLSWAAIFLFIHGRSPKKLLKYTVEKIPESRFHLSEDWSHKAALAMASYWNTTVNDLKSLCCGNDWNLFLKMVIFLIVVRFLASTSPQGVFLKAIPLVFLAFNLYELYEEEIDSLFLYGLSFMSKKSDEMRKLSPIKVGKSE
ncbi:3beta-hydroxysteroid-dehydrogenase/decarboxylase [Heracleum sosnowskyi]|uniref:Reticulon-like protein n=1 Tax=Heracleum sosnowskyi TaxID=360622 RepID=A0AAD8MXJ4_9APIA|nr:3beta-hydroxysteroid-dehydrogenase/decarboxylase [Heracleum sosnowskyi]